MIVEPVVKPIYDLAKMQKIANRMRFMQSTASQERWKQISREAGELYFRKKREERWSYLDTRNTLRHAAFMHNMRMMIRGWCEDEFKKG